MIKKNNTHTRERERDVCVFEEFKGEKKHEFFIIMHPKKSPTKKGRKKTKFFFSSSSFHNDDGDLDFTSDALELHAIREAKQHDELLYPIHIKGTENIYSRRFQSNLHFLSVMMSRIECILNCTHQFLIV